MNPKAYGKLIGVVLLLVGVVGLLMPTLLGMDLSKRHSAVHLATGALLAWLGFGGVSAATTKAVVLVLGIVYAGLGVAGFFVDQILPMMRIFHTDVLTNVFHLAVGGLGIIAGTIGSRAIAPTPATV